MTALFGPSGCGKTTLLRAIAGLDRYPASYFAIGEEVWQDQGRFVPTHQRSLGVVFQEASLLSHLSVQQNLEYGFRRVNLADRQITLDQVVAWLRIEDLLHRKPTHLSGGERQRVAIARALARSPRLLLMDEPLAGLDLDSRLEILPYIESLRAELAIPIVYVSHAREEVARLADHLILLEQGRVKGAGPIGEIFTCLDLPLARRQDAEAILNATVVGHDERYHLTYLDSEAGRITVIQRALAIGEHVRLRIAARDVSLTLEPQTNTSILNIFPATVDALAPEGKAQMTVRLLVGESPLLARVTCKSASVLDLKPGKRVYAQAKSVALLS